MHSRLLTLAALLLAAPALADDTVTVKLGTLAPQGSSWHTLLKEMGERFSEVSGAKVKVKIYAGGTQGTEADMVRKMSVGQLQAASISNVGMHDIATEPMIFSAPGMVDEDLTKALLPQMSKRMEAAFEAKGFIVLHWASIGSVRVFCTKPYPSAEEAADGKFFVWDGDPGSIVAFREMGLHTVTLASTDIIPSLETGLITCITQAPAFTLTTRGFEKAKFMLDYPISFLVGATLVKKEVWEKIPADVRPKLLEIAKDIGTRVDNEVKKLNDDAVVAMKKQGLTVVPANAASWEAASKKAWPTVRSKVVPEAFFDEFVKARDAAKKAPKK